MMQPWKQSDSVVSAIITEVMYEEQFKRYLLIAKSFVPKLKKRQDRKICIHWIQRLAYLASCNATVGINRNLFFQYFIWVIQQAVVEDMLKDAPGHTLSDFKHIPVQGLSIAEDPNWLENELDLPEMPEVAKGNDAPYFAHWSDDQRTYIAAKALPGKGALIYMAVATDPSAGWSNLAE